MTTKCISISKNKSINKDKGGSKGTQEGLPPICDFVIDELSKLADAKKAVEMAAYMKTQMPFYGVQKPERLPIIRQIKKDFRPESQKSYEENVLALWALEHREAKYIAINYAESFPEFVTAKSMDLYERLIREGAWWDFVDAISSHLAGEAYLKERKELKGKIDTWSKDKNMWIRRASILVHLSHKDDTDCKQLFALCTRLSHEKEFFIQKAIGWALREYSKTNPEEVKRYLKANQHSLSPLSFREGAKHLLKEGKF